VSPAAKEGAPDSQGIRDAAMALPDHLRDAQFRIETARLQPMEAPASFVCGMGGSAIGGDLAAAVLGDRLSRPFMTVRGYELPPWAPAGSAVLCSSYSGDTEETLACYAAAEALGGQRIVATTGGRLAEAAREDGVPVIGLPGLVPQPRAAVGYMFCAAVELAVLSLASARIATEVDGAAEHLASRSEAIAERAAELAERVGDATPVIYGADLTAAAAYRWKTQVNENSKAPAFFSRLPEADHNELPGWSGADGAGPFAAILLEDADQHPRERRRIELTAELIGPHASAVATVEVEGQTRTARVLELVMLGDLFSIELAARRGVDPGPIDAIAELKERMGRPE
jgi:glucose/mannose-6-phosphate isomerase